MGEFTVPFFSGWTRSRRRGGALILALLVIALLLVLGVAFLSFLERDYRLAGCQERSEQAWFLARAGVEYALATGLAPGEPVCRSLPEGSSTHSFEVQVHPDGTLVSRGLVRQTLSWSERLPVFERTLVVPSGLLEEAHEPFF